VLLATRDYSHGDLRGIATHITMTINDSTSLVDKGDDSEACAESGAPHMEAQLRALIAKQEERFADIAEQVARVRHEINNPLTGVIGQTQLLLREELPETARKRVETIEQLAVRIRDTVAELRDIQSPHVVSDYGIKRESAASDKNED
jgi:signal transduction histidine kinase